MSLEIECKIHVPDLDTIRQQLDAAGAIIRKPRVYEKNIRYENPARDLTENDIVLRLRQDREARITYKAPADTITNDGTITRLELETTVGDLAAMDAILQRLGFMPYMVYEKYRTTYELPAVPGAEIVLDEMPYGDFMEVEGTTEAIDDVLGRLGLADARRIPDSYSTIFDKVREQHGLEFTDLTFENFADVAVDSNILERL